MSNEQSCPCGLFGGNCTELSLYLDTYEDAMDSLCSAEGFSECFVSNNYGAVCVCECGFKGDFCEEKPEPTTYNQILGIIIPISLICFALYYLKKLRVLKVEQFRKSPKHLTVGKGLISPRTLFCYRFFIGVLGVVMFTTDVAEFGFGQFKFFTNWSWIIFTFVFFLGSFLSFSNIYTPNKSRTKFSILEKIFYICFEVVFVVDVFIAVVVWGVLYPSLLPTGQGDAINNTRSYFVHGLNFGFLALDFLVTEITIIPSHVFFTIAYLSLFTFFHSMYTMVRFYLGENMCSLYSFLDEDTPLFPFAILGLILLAIIFHMLMVLVSKYKTVLSVSSTDNKVGVSI
eukprot:maker-scaffold_10-snap-gene-10.40-mRNA-1 protein AED:0.30 eAED:0.30 QI:277/1/1/1/1/1/2/40/342